MANPIPQNHRYHQGMAPASSHSTRWLLVAAAASSVACTRGNASGVTRREFDLFSISVPTAWTQVVYGPSDVHKGLHQFGGPGVRFEGPDGEYLDISPDLCTRDAAVAFLREK